jgi:hypothetical protein
VLTDAVAYSLVNVPLEASVQSYLYPLDNPPAMDFRLGAAATGPIAEVPPPAAPPGAPAPTGPGTIPTTGGLGAPVLAVFLIGLALLLARNRRRRVT